MLDFSLIKRKLLKKIPAKGPVSILLISLGILLIFFGKPTLKQLSLVSSFRDEPVVIENLNGDQSGEIPVKITIENVNIDIAVKEAKIVDGYWEVFPNVAGWGEGSGKPGRPGNQVVFAHARKGLFLPLRDVKIGSIVKIETTRDSYSYEVKEIKEVLPNQVEVISTTEDETLTLYTCTGFNDSKRLIVVAKRI